MITRKSEAEWTGDLKAGSGKIKFGSGVFEGPYNFTSRFEGGKATNPEELIAAAHAGCFSMALSAMLGEANIKADRIHTTAEVKLEQMNSAWVITNILLKLEAAIPGIDQTTFMQHATKAKENCPVSKALASVKIDLDAKLV